jgi:erythromycin esterase-like protein
MGGADSAEAFVEWGRRVGLPIDTLDWRKSGLCAAPELDRLLEGKRIVFLGEPDHNVSERLDYRLVMLRCLWERGFRWVAAERGFSDGLRIDRYLASGDPAELDRVGCLGYRGALRPGRDEGADPHQGRWPPDWIERHRAEERWFYTELRSLGPERPGSEDRIHFYGFDAEMMPGGGYQDIAELMRAAPGAPACSELRERLAPVEGETLDAEVLRLDTALELVDRLAAELSGALGPRPHALLVESIVALRDSFMLRAELVRQLETGKPDPARWYQKMAERERGMCRRMDWLLDRIGPAGKVVLLGHNEHLAKDQRALWLGRSGDPPIPPMLTLGHHLNRLHAGQVLSIWLLFDRGRHYPHPMDPRKQMTVESDPARIEHLLGKIGSAYLLPLATEDPAATLLDQKWDYWTGAASHSCIPRSQADAIFFLREVREPRERP